MFRPIRLVLGLAIVLSLVLSALAGCATPAPAPTATSAPKAAAPTATTAPAATKAPAPTATKAAPQAAKVITVAQDQEPDTLLPGLGAMMAKTMFLKGPIFTPLVMRDEKNVDLPWGAENVPTLENGGAKFVGEGADKHLELTFKIKQNLKWQDGTPVTAADFQFSLDLMWNPDFPAQQRDLALKLAEMLAPDPKTLVVKFKSEKQAHEAAAKGWKFDNKDFYKGYEAQVGPVVDPEYWYAADVVGDEYLPKHILSKIDPKDIAKSDYARNPVGSGPYKVKEWIPAQRIVLEAVDTSVFGKAKTETIVFRFLTDATGILNALSAGEVQVATQMGLALDQTPELDKLEQQGKIKGYYVPGQQWEHLDFNFKQPLFQDKLVRQALAHAMDRKTIVDKVLFGKSVVQHSWIPAPSWALDEAALKKYDYNPQKAKDLLEQAGWKMGASGFREKDGQQLKFKLQTTTAAVRQTVAPLIQANFKDVGVNLELEFLPGRGLFETNGPLMTRTFDTALYTWITSTDPDPLALYHTRNCPEGANYPCWSNTRADTLMEQASSELSIEKRKPLYSELLKIWTEELPTIPIFQRIVVDAAHPKLQGFKPTPTTTPETWNMHEWFLPTN